MTRWSYEPNRVVIRRPNPNFTITWTLALTAPIQIAIGACALLALDPPYWVLLGLVAAAINWALAGLDGRRIQGLPDRAATNPMLAAASPLFYLFIRSLRHPDPRAGRPFWGAVAATPAALFLLAVAVLGRYAAFVHGF